MMFRPLRRIRQALSDEEINNILDCGTTGVLALHGDDGYPYAVPLNYLFDRNKIYFHCACTGHKLDAIKKESKASFCVIGHDQVVPEEYTSYFRSVIVFGSIRILDDDEEKYRVIDRFAEKYVPDDLKENRRKAIEKSWEGLCILEMSIDHSSGKEAIELKRGKIGMD